MVRRIEILLLLTVALLASGCKKAPISPDKMEDILFDIYRTDACISIGARDISTETKVKYYDSVFEKHGVTKEEFDEALDWYAHHTQEWLMIHERLEARTDEFVAKVDDYEFSPSERPGAQDSIDTLDLWVPKVSWEWREGDGEIDRRQTDYTWDNRKYFIGARNLRFEMRMRCWNGVKGDSVTSMMVLRYSKGENDTLRYVAPVDSVERIYRFNKMTRGKSVSMVRVMIMDTVDGLKGVNVKGARLNYAYNNREKSIEEVDEEELRILRREVRTGRSAPVEFVMPKGGPRRPKRVK